MYNQLIGKKCLVTGHTGFKGSWLSIVLNKLGAKVFGISFDKRDHSGFFHRLQMVDEFETYELDINDLGGISNVVKKIKPDYVFHFAAQSLVLRSYQNPVETFRTNVIGTQNILEAVRLLDNAPVCIFATTDKVYKNDGSGVAFIEDDELGGADPYSASKAAKELLIASYVQSFLSKQGVRVGVARAGNVIGGGDWNENRLVPDIYRSWLYGSNLKIRHPNAIRPWQHVLEPIFGYIEFAIWLAKRSEGACEVLNFGPPERDLHSVKDVCDAALKFMPSLSIELFNSELYEASALSLNTDKMNKILNFYSIIDFETTMKWTFEWYVQLKSGETVESLCARNIEDYLDAKKMV